MLKPIRMMLHCPPRKAEISFIAYFFIHKHYISVHHLVV